MADCGMWLADPPFSFRNPRLSAIVHFTIENPILASRKGGSSDPGWLFATKGLNVFRLALWNLPGQIIEDAMMAAGEGANEFGNRFQVATLDGKSSHLQAGYSAFGADCAKVDSGTHFPQSAIKVVSSDPAAADQRCYAEC